MTETTIEEKNVTFNKSQCERYDVHVQKPFRTWGIFTLDERGGLLNIVSDFGNYGYVWPYHGRESFKHFLIELDMDYLFVKLLQCRESYIEINLEKTKKMWRDKVIYNRRHGELSRGGARDVWEEIEEFYSSEISDLIGYDCKISQVLYGGDYPETVSEVRADLKNFYDILWKEFMSILKEEVNNNAKS